MCGIVGFIGKDNFSVSDIKMLMIYNETRGGDGCGIYNEGKITKENKSGIDTLHNMVIQPEKLFMGHMRKATFPSYKKEKHTHPLQSENIIGIHNGTLSFVSDLAKEVGIKPLDYDIDSEVLVAAIAKDVTLLRKIKGSASILYVDTTMPNRLYAFRKNDDRPLFRGNKEEGMYISSIEQSLMMIGCKEIKSFKTEYLYVIEDGKIIETRPMPTEVEKVEHISKKFKKYVQGQFENRDLHMDGQIYYPPTTVMEQDVMFEGEFVKVTTQPRQKSVNVGTIYAVRGFSGSKSDTVSVFNLKKDGSLDISNMLSIDKKYLINIGTLKQGNLAISRANGGHVRVGDILLVDSSGYKTEEADRTSRQVHKTSYDILGNIDPREDEGRSVKDYDTTWEFYSNRLCPLELTTIKELFEKNKQEFLGKWLLEKHHITEETYNKTLGIEKAEVSTDESEEGVEIIPSEDEITGQDMSMDTDIEAELEDALINEVIPKVWMPVGSMYGELEECIEMLKDVGTALYSGMAGAQYTETEQNLVMALDALETINKGIYERAKGQQVF